MPLRLAQKVQFLNFLPFQAQQFLFLNLLGLHLLQNILMVVLDEEFSQLKVVDYWVAFSAELIEFYFVVQLIFFVLVEELELVDFGMA